MFSLTSYESQAQTNTATHLVIQGLSVYPNPVTNGKSSVSITSNTNSIKTVAIYNVLGKKIQAAVATRKTLDISTLSAGVYILEITQGNASETRKLIVR
jgi:hypothetical protein